MPQNTDLISTENKTGIFHIRLQKEPWNSSADKQTNGVLSLYSVVREWHNILCPLRQIRKQSCFLNIMLLRHKLVRFITSIFSDKENEIINVAKCTMITLFINLLNEY